MDAIILAAAGQAADEIDFVEQQGSNVASWTEPAERAVFQPEGAIAVPAIVPLPNRGSYGQVVEPLVNAGS